MVGFAILIMFAVGRSWE